LTVLVKQLDGVPADVLESCRQLQFRNTVLIYLEVLKKDLFPDNWIYVHSSKLRCGRITNFRNWVPNICGRSPHTILALEYWCNSDDEFWSREEEDLIRMARNEIVLSGLVGAPEEIGRAHVVRIPKSYPIYQKGYQEHVALIRSYLDSIAGLQVIGRYGSFKYNNQDHSILMGRLAAENVVSDFLHDLWSVNTDYETYQESCSITETGLVQTAG